MPSQMQRVQIGKANYSGSALATRNAALRRASLLGAVLIGAKGVGLERLQNSERLLTVLDYCQSGARKTTGPPRLRNEGKQMDARWEKALPAPLDQTRSMELPGGEYDESRPLYQCAVCLDFGEKNLHRYVDECPSFGD